MECRFVCSYKMGDNRHGEIHEINGDWYLFVEPDIDWYPEMADCVEVYKKSDEHGYIIWSVVRGETIAEGIRTYIKEELTEG